MTAGTHRSRVYLDTHVLIYAFEDDPKFGPVARDVLQAAVAASLLPVTSALTIAEVLVVPIRKRDTAAIALYEAFLGDAEKIEVVPIDTSVLRSAAELRASTKLKLPDAIHVATALRHGCTAFVSEDRRIKPPAPLEIVTLSDRLSTP